MISCDMQTWTSKLAQSSAGQGGRQVMSWLRNYLEGLISPSGTSTKRARMVGTCGHWIITQQM